MENRKKIKILNLHFAYINKELYSELCKELQITDFLEYIKKKVKKQFNITLSNVDDFNELIKAIKEDYYDSPSDWLREKIREDLKINGYQYYIDEMICLADIQTEEDIKEANDRGYIRVKYTADELKKRFPLLDVNKIFYNNTILGQMVYYDKEKYAMTEISAGYLIGADTDNIDNYSILVPPGFGKPEEESILMKIDFIWEEFQKGNFEMFKFMNMPLYVNEIIDTIIRNTDKIIRAKWRKVKKMDIS